MTSTSATSEPAAAAAFCCAWFTDIPARPPDTESKVVTVSVSLPNAMPRSQPRPVPLSASDTSPLVMTCAFADLTAPACASAEAYEPSSSSMPVTAENLPWPFSIVDLPTVSPPPLAVSLTLLD